MTASLTPEAFSEMLQKEELSTHICRGLAADLLQKLQWRLATAESCTGGMIAAVCTDVSGSSTWFDRGFVTYSNEAKTDMLGVNDTVIAREGAVSEPVVRAMAEGALKHSRAQVSVAVTGVAGPTGGSAAKPVGTVWFAWATPQGVTSEIQHFSGDRAAVRRATVRHALQQLVTLLQKQTLEMTRVGQAD